MTEKKIELERTAKASLAKLPQLKITPFKGTAANWVRFENMFLTQINSRPISDEEEVRLSPRVCRAESERQNRKSQTWNCWI